MALLACKLGLQEASACGLFSSIVFLSGSDPTVRTLVKLEMISCEGAKKVRERIAEAAEEHRGIRGKDG